VIAVLETDLLIRGVNRKDAAGVVAVLNSIIAAGEPVAFDEPLSVEAECAYINGFPERGVFLVAIDAGDGRLVGWQSTEPFATYTYAFDHVGVIGTY